MHISELGESKYLKKEECEPPIRVTIVGVKQDNLAKDGEPPEYKFILSFKECKPLVLNKTNGGRIAHVLGSPESDDWVGKTIDLFNDPTVEFGGNMTGGIRVLVPQPTAQTPPAAPAQPVGDMDDDIPF